MNNGYNAWNVYDSNGNWIDTVFYEADCGAEYILNSLICHDCLDPNIRISKDDKTHFSM